MRRILINSTIDEIAERYAGNLFLNGKPACKPKRKLELILERIEKDKCRKWKKYFAYVKALYDKYEKILVLHPRNFKRYKTLYFSNLSEKELNSTTWRKWGKKQKKITFCNTIIAAMRYEDIRSQEIVKYIDKELRIKTCVYCNANYIASVNVPGEGLKARYEIDHFLPKYMYPFLCTSFFNFQPSCSFCNRWKLKDESLFNLYTDKQSEVNPFVFSLDQDSILLYKTDRNAENLCIDIESKEIKKIGGKVVKLIDNHNTVFHISALYEAFKEEAEEILIRYLNNTQTYLNQMQNNIIQNSNYNVSTAFRLTNGFLYEEENVHLKPLSKMKRDIAKQLGLI